jgi:hypothetical protein
MEGVMVFNATFNNISVISWRSVLFVEEPGIYKEDSVMMSYCEKQNEKSLKIFITVDIFKHTAKKIRKLNEKIKFYLKCMVPP